jgi:hypothetical protein
VCLVPVRIESLIRTNCGGHSKGLKVPLGVGTGRGGAGIGLFPTRPAPSGFGFFQLATRAKITISAHVWGLRSVADRCGLCRLGGFGTSLPLLSLLYVEQTNTS